MKQLDDIVDMAAGDDARLVTILRMCLVVAAELNNESLRDWATAELNGYKDHLSAPDYRIARVTAKGFFVGPLGAQINDQPLSAGVLEKQHRWWATTAYLNESISAYEAMVAGDGKKGAAMVHWPADLVARYQSKYIQGYVLNRAWQEISIGAIVAVVDTVRTRLLQFALELQSEIGSSDEAAPSPESVERSVQTIIYGGTNLVGAVDGNVQLIGQQVVIQGDFESLEAVLKTVGVTDCKVDELKQAIESDLGDGAEKGFGSRVAGWLQNAGTYVGKEGLKTGLEIGQKAATKAVLTYFGLPS